MKKILSILCAIVACMATNAYGQSYDEKIGDAMNRHDWFALDSIYKTAPKDSIHEFLEVFSRCLLGNRLNRQDVSVKAFEELLNRHSTYLDLNNLVSSAYMYGMDLNRIGKNEAAASMINSVIDASKQYLDSITIEGLKSTANRYSALSRSNPYGIDFNGESIGRVPFTIVPVGPEDKAAVLMHLQDCSINGMMADITFDTVAGTNLISHEMAVKFNLTALDDTRITVTGVDSRDGYVAIAKEMQIGNMTLTDVPFTVMSLSSGNDEADRYIDCFNIVVGSDMMLQMKDLTIDFAKRMITVPSAAPEKSDATPNMCFSSTMNLLTKGTVLSMPLLMCMDSGDASFGSLNKNFFEANIAYVTSHAEPDTIREAGIGGVIRSKCYYVPDMPVRIGGNTVTPPVMTVRTDDNSMIGDYDCIIGLKTLMMYGKVRFNLVDFVLTTDAPQSGVVSLPPRGHSGIADLQFAKEPVMNPWQTMGFIAVGIARTMINPNAPTMPDL